MGEEGLGGSEEGESTFGEVGILPCAPGVLDILVQKDLVVATECVNYASCSLTVLMCVGRG